MLAARVHLKPRKALPFFGRHPWVLDSAVARVEGQPDDGDEIDLISDRDEWIARGIYNSHSRICVRLYSWSADESLDAAFWRKRIERAVAHRAALGYQDPEGATRLVFSEADGISGLVVDRYGPYLVVQCTALAIARRLDELLAVCHDLLAPQAIVLRTEKGVARREGIEPREGVITGELPSGPVFITEHGLRYGIDLVEGQKTGWYLDHRENRRAAAGYLRDLRVLDLFSYSGGFAIAALALGGAREVLAVDASQRAVALARANAELNGLARIRIEAAEAFETLDRAVEAGERFGAVVLDPPKFAQRREAVPEALRAYFQLNRRAVELIEPGGVLVTCSCSGHVSREDFQSLLARVAQRTGRDVQILEQRGAAPDHPISATCLDSEYLKCFICRVW